MLNKIFYTIDSISRFQPKQLYYWIVNKYLKKILPAENIDISKVDNIEISDLHEAIKKAEKLFALDDKSIYKFGLKNPLQHHPYYFQAKDFIENISKDTYGFSKINSEDDEIINNYHRFFLFAEIFSDSNCEQESRINLIINWIGNVPRSNKKAWTGFNATIRLLNWIKILIDIDKNFVINETDSKKIIRSIFENIYFVRKHIEYHIPGNHIIFQFYILWLISEIFPNWKDSKEINQFAYKNLVEEFDAEFLESGFHFEQSYHYHLQITLLGIYWKYNLSKLGKKLDPKIKSKIENAVRLTDKFILGNEYIPMLADNCFTFFHENNYEDFSNLNYLRNNIFNISDESKNNEEIENQYIIANKFNKKLIVDVGNIGLPCNPGHGHSDIFSFLFSYKEQPIFIDPGTRKYNNSKEDMLLKKTTSHNTLSVNGEDQSKLWGFFRWAYLPKNIRYNFEESEDSFYFSGSFIGFRHLGHYKHSREIDLQENQIIIKDSIDKQFDKIYLSFVLHQDVLFDKTNNMIFSNEKIKKKFIVNSEFPFEIIFEEYYVYPNYDFPVKSNKITVIFKSEIKKSFYSEIIVKDII